jgi:hypothetical protein
MSWHYLQGGEGASWAGNSLDGAPAALLKLMPMPALSCSHDSATDASTRSPYGMTSPRSTEDLGAGQSISSAGDSPARISVAPEEAPGSTARDPGYGPRWRELLVRFDPITSSWKTHLCLFEEDFPESSVILPRWGMMRGGVLWERITPPPLTSATASGSLPTPKHTDAERGGRGDLIQAIRGNPNSHYKLWPTPHGMSKDGKTNGPSGNELGRAVNLSPATWPTPTSCMHKGTSPKTLTRKNGKTRHRDQLDHAVLFMEKFAMPQSRDYRTGERDRWENPQRTRNLNDQIGGSLNPSWVEWLMGWPIGWTDCAASATGRFLQWLRSHGVS